MRIENERLTRFRQHEAEASRRTDPVRLIAWSVLGIVALSGWVMIILAIHPF